MFYAFVKDGVVTYPYTITDFRLANPNISMRESPPPDSLTDFGLYPVEPADEPAYDITKNAVRSAAPRGGKWFEEWTVTDASPDEVEARLASKRAGMEVSMRQARLALLGAGKGGVVDTALSKLPSPMKEAAQIEWEYASTIRRDSPLIAQLGPAIGMTDEQVDALFEAAAKL